MHGLPDDFADTLSRVIDPESQDDAARVIDAAAQLDDEELRVFLKLFAARVRESTVPITGAELRRFLRTARPGPA